MFPFLTIKTFIYQLVQPLHQAFKAVFSHFQERFGPERVQLTLTLASVLIFIIFKGPANGQPGIVGSVIRHYVEETSASIIKTDTNLRLADINSLMGTTGSIPQQVPIDASPKSYAIQENMIQAVDSVSTDFLDSFKADQVIKYNVQSGDSIGSIAVDFGVSVNTIVWANSLKNPDALSLGQVLTIPPVTGIIYTVQNGDTVASIANKYKGDPSKIISFNDLTGDQSLYIGDILIVPGGEMPGPKPTVKSVAKGSKGSGIYVSVGNGQCVPFVQAHGFSNLHGNAYAWAQYINTKTPTVGGVVVLRGGRFGHVALITSVKPDSVQVVEQNYYGPYVIDHREIALNDGSVVGFIR